MTETHFVMASEWMAHGNINQYVTAHPDANRFELVCFRSYPRNPQSLTITCFCS